MLSKEQLKKELSPCKLSIADIMLTVLFVFLMCSVVVIRGIYRHTITGTIMFIVIVGFYTWRMRKRYRPLLFRITVLTVFVIFMLLWELSDRVKNYGPHVALLFAASTAGLTLIFNVICLGFYDIVYAIKKVRNKE